MKAQWDGGGRILLSDKTGGGAVMLQLIGFSALESGFQLDCLVYAYVVDYVCTQ